jgi:hypothetical protein
MIHREAYAVRQTGNGRTLVKVDSLRMNAYKFVFRWYDETNGTRTYRKRKLGTVGLRPSVYENPMCSRQPSLHLFWPSWRFGSGRW